ncbi:hypothetical protein L218DRAFT_940335 [Marasmius fiardii PR-910]|nr:hypothetical protein L218DRAFT_940335 [Marasmius fiardii PR-910]
MHSLPEEIYVAILVHLPLQDVLKLRRVSKNFRDLTYSRDLWIRLLREETQIKRRIPVPGLQNVDSLPTTELERCVQRSLQLHRNWSSPSPITAQKSVLLTGRSSPNFPSLRIISLHFITLSGYFYLLAVSYKQHFNPRTLLFELWDIGHADKASCVAWREIRWSGGYSVNTTCLAGEGVLAIKTPDIEIWDVDLSKVPESAFVTLQTLSVEAKTISAYTGATLLILGLNDEVNILDIRNPSLKVELRHPQPVLPTNQPHILESIIEHDYALVVRPTTLELYSLDEFRKGANVQVVSPIVAHHFQWRLDSCRIERDVKRYPSFSPKSRRPTPINILLRFSSLFPWPVNLLQHYILHPNDLYTPSSDSTPTTIGRDNSPYHFPPVLHQTISSPIRLFAVSDMALGCYGSAVWIDSHTEEYFLQGETGQRLAGLMLSPVVLGDELPDEDGDTVSEEPPDLTDKQTQAHASSVFEVQEVDDWNRVAVDEREGRVAVGSVNGRITLYEYI